MRYCEPGITKLDDWLRKLAPLFDQSEVKPKPIMTCLREKIAQLFLRLVRIAGLLQVSFAWQSGLFCTLCDWPEKLHWFWFCDTQQKTTSLVHMYNDDNV